MVSGQGKISARQLMILTTLYTVGSAILIIPSGMAFVAKQDAWLAAKKVVDKEEWTPIKIRGIQMLYNLGEETITSKPVSGQ